MSKVLDITKYTEVDDASKLVVSYTGVTATALSTRNDLAYVYKDYGAGFFSSGYRLDCYLSVTAANRLSNTLYHTILTNGIGPIASISEYQGIFYVNQTTGDYRDFGLSERVAGSVYYSTYVKFATPPIGYYVTIIRDEAVGTYGTLYLYFYSDAARTTLSGSTSLALHAKTDYRYHVLMQSMDDDAVADSISGAISDVLLTKFEDFTTYTEVDPYGWKSVVSENQVHTAPAGYYERGFFYKDMGENWCNGNIVLEWAKSFTQQDNGGTVAYVALSTVVGGFREIQLGGGNNLWFGYDRQGGNNQNYLRETAAGSTTSTANLPQGTYQRAVLDRSASTNGTAYLYSYTNAARTTLAGPAISLALRQRVAYRYIHLLQGPAATPPSSLVGPFVAAADVWDLAIIENHRYEDFTTYTEVDPNSRVTVSADSVVGAGLQRSTASAVLYKDYGADHFNGSFLLEWDFVATLTSGINAGPWMVRLSNDTGIVQSPYPDAISAFVFMDGGLEVAGVAESYAGVNYTNYWSNMAAGTTYYVRMIRDETVGTYGTLYLYAYSNAARTSLVSSTSLALHGKVDFRYLSPIVESLQAAQTGISALTLSKLDLNEDYVAAGGFLTRNYWWQRTHGNLIGV